MKDPYQSLLMALVLTLLFPYFLISAILEASIWFASKSWRGRAVATVKDLKKVYHFKGRTYYKEWFEIPVITYQVGDAVYTEEYSHAEQRAGFYTVSQEIPILYNEAHPKEFIFEGEYSNSDIFSCLIAEPVVCLVMLCLAVYGYANYYLGTHELLFEKETWETLASPFPYKMDNHDFSWWRDDNTDTLEEYIEEAILHFRQLDERIGQEQGGRAYDDYRGRYEKAAKDASRDLADLCSQCIAQFSIQCGLKGEEAAIWKSVYAEFLRQICPEAAPPAGVYSMEEALFMMAAVGDARSLNLSWRDAPEENIGLFLAASCAGRHSVAEMFSYEPSVKDKIVQGFSGFIPLYMEEVNGYLEYRPGYGDSGSKDAYPPLDPDPVYAVYDYTMEQYFDTGSFETALWEGAVFAHAHLLSRLEANPGLGKLERFQDENNFFAEFDPQKGPDFYFSEEREYRPDSLRQLYHSWEWCAIDAEGRRQRFSEQWK